MPARAGLWLATAAIAWALIGCSTSGSSPLRRAAETTSSAALDQSLATLERPETRERIQQLMATPEMRQAIRDAAADAANSALVQRVAAVAMRSAMDQAGNDWSQTLGPAIQDSMVAMMNSPEVRRALDRTADEVTGSALERARGVLRIAAVAGAVLGALVLLLLVWGVRTQIVLTRLLKAIEHGAAGAPEPSSHAGPIHPRAPLEA